MLLKANYHTMIKPVSVKTKQKKKHSCHTTFTELTDNLLSNSSEPIYLRVLSFFYILIKKEAFDVMKRSVLFQKLEILRSCPLILCP